MEDVELDVDSDLEAFFSCEADAFTDAPQPLNEAEAAALIALAVDFTSLWDPESTSSDAKSLPPSCTRALKTSPGISVWSVTAQASA